MPMFENKTFNKREKAPRKRRKESAKRASADTHSKSIKEEVEAAFQ